MLSKIVQSARLLAMAIAASLAMANTAVAGPPLICHAFDIGNGKSLPWISHDWNLSGAESYDTHRLAGDTLAVLNSSQIALLHMETLRRATLYARRDPAAAKQLLLQIVTRAKSSEASSSPDAFALFDAAYLSEAYKQWLGENNPANGLDGLPWMTRAMKLHPDDAQMAFAAALITLHGPDNEQQRYARQAAAGATHDELLARNLASRFLNGPTMSQMIAKNSEPKAVRQ